MDDKNIKLFENKRVRTAWDEEKEEGFVSIVDVVGVLTDQLTHDGGTEILERLKGTS
jgi:hypothetical protein